MKTTSKQRGIALLVFLTVLTTASVALAVKVIHNNNRIARDRITAAALAQAKDALIGYAIAYGNTHPGQVHGYLPCPDTSGTDIGGEGAAAGVCGSQNVSQIGRLPWKTLELGPLRAGDGECLWYAVSGTYKFNPQTNLMNWDTNGQLQVYASDGTTLLTPTDNQAVAVIFAPGAALPGQDRAGTTAPVCGGNYAASNYLDTAGTFNNASVSGTANANSQFRVGDTTLPTSDQMIFITRQDIWNAMQKRRDFLVTLDNLTQKTAECIAGFGFRNNIASNKSLPWPAQLDLADYSANSNYSDHDGLSAGHIPYRVKNSREQTGNSIHSPYTLLQADGANCPAGWSTVYPWWANWKDHLFYAVSQRFQPDNDATAACDSDHCLHINGSGNYAAIVIFANQRLAGQTRASSVTDSQRGIAANYLEDRNAANIPDPDSSGHGNYQIAASSTFNDIVYCIRENLTVVKGDPSATPACP